MPEPARPADRPRAADRPGAAEREPRWQKSSFSSSTPNGDCLELAAGPGGTVLLRESARPAAVLPADRRAVRMLLARLKSAAQVCR